MKLSRHDLLAHLFPILLGQFVSLAIGVISVRLASHWVAPADYGVYGLFTSLTPLGFSVVYAGVLKYLARHWTEAGERDALRRGALCSAGRKLPWLLAGAAGVAALLPGKWAVSFPALALASAGLSVVAFVQTALQAERRNWLDFLVGTLASLLRTFLPLLLYAGLTGDLRVLLAGFALHAAAAALLALFIGGWRRAFTPGAAERITGSFEGPRFALLATVGWAMGGSARWLVATFFGAEEAGFFVLAGNVALIVISLLFAVVQQFVQPRLFARPCSSAEERRRLAGQTDWISAGFLVLAVAGLAALTAMMPWLIGPLISEHYARAAGWVLPAGCFHAALLMPHFFHLMLLAARREAACGPAEIAGALAVLAGAIPAAFGGSDVFRAFCLASPVLAWAVARPLARKLLLNGRN